MRIRQLDLLRGVAVLLVLGRHPVIEPAQAGIFRPLAELWLRIGWTGVDLFFVLSGFLIGGLLFTEIKRTSTLDVPRFLVRRLFKIWPGYHLLVLFVLFAVPMSAPTGEPLAFGERVSMLMSHFGHAQNYHPTLKLHTWSLAIEEHFYLVLPVFLLLVIRLYRSKPERLFLVISSSAVLLCIACLTMRLNTTAAEFSGWLNPTHLRIDSLFFGVFLAAVFHFRTVWFERVARHRVLLAIVGLLLISPMLFLTIESSGFVVTWGFSLLYVGYGCLLIAAMPSRAASQSSTTVGSRALVFIGVSSYSVYLWHWHTSAIIKAVSANLFPQFGSMKWALFTSIYVLAATYFGYFMNRLVESPAIRLRDRMVPSKTTDERVQPMKDKTNAETAYVSEFSGATNC